MLKNRGRIFWIVVAVILLLVIFFSIKWINKDVVSVKTYTVNYSTIEAVVSASGIIDAPVYALGTKTGGKLASISVKEGDIVKKGTTLAEFDDLTRIVAPDKGIIAKIANEVGETVSPGSAAITIVNYDKSWVDAQIDEIDIADVKIGDQVKVTSDVYPDKIFEGQIYWIAPLAELRKVGGRVKMDEESYVFPCKIKFLGDHKDLKANMSVNVEIAIKTKVNALSIPREAIISADDTSCVFKINKNRALKTKIEIGIRSFSSVEAITGVSIGDVLAITNVSKLKDKGRVKIEQ